MPGTPGQNSLSVEGGIAAIIEAMSASTSAKIRIVGLLASGEAGEEIIPAYKETVLEELEASCNIAHFACHRVADYFSPLRSGFMPKEKSGDTIIDMLAIREITNTLTSRELMGISEPHANVAFLPVQLLPTLSSSGMELYILRVDPSWSGFRMLLGLYGRQMVMWQPK